MEVKEETIYARLFGGIFSRLDEYGGDVTSPMYIRATEMLDKYLERNLDNSVLDEDLVNWIDSKVLDDLRCEDKPQEKIYSQEGEYFFDSFVAICGGGHLELAKWYVQKCGLKASRSAFVKACRNGHCNVVKWLVETFPDIDVHMAKDYGFRLACMEEHQELIKWFRTNHSPLPNFELISKELKDFGMKDTHIVKFFERAGENMEEIFEEDRNALYPLAQQLFQEEDDSKERMRKLTDDLKTGLFKLTIEQEAKSIKENYGLEMTPEIISKFEELKEFVRTCDNGLEISEKLNKYLKYVKNLSEKQHKCGSCCTLM